MVLMLVVVLVVDMHLLPEVGLVDLVVEVLLHHGQEVQLELLV